MLENWSEAGDRDFWEDSGLWAVPQDSPLYDGNLIPQLWGVALAGSSQSAAQLGNCPGPAASDW